MRRVVLLCLVFTFVLFPATARTADQPSAADYQRAEYIFRAAVDAWAYQRWGTLWEMGNAMYRAHIPLEAFTARMRQTYQRSAAGRQMEELVVSLHSTTYATANARLGVENVFEPNRRDVSRMFYLKFEDGDWHVDLYDFLSLVR